MSMIESLTRSRLAESQREATLLRVENQLLEDEVRELRADAVAYQTRIDDLNRRVEELESDASTHAPAFQVGKEVRLRYLEAHRRRMGKMIGSMGQQAIQAGHRAAHRGRPLVDAWLCTSGLFPDIPAFVDLYGVSPDHVLAWRDVPEMLDATGFRASLQGEGCLTSEFQVIFGDLVALAEQVSVGEGLRDAFLGTDARLRGLHQRLQDCFDRIIPTRRI